MRKRLLTVSLTVFASVLFASGIIYAATYNVTSRLGGTTGDSFDVDGTMIFDSIKVGAQDVGGVTFFNGTVVNNTTTSGADNPVTFGDNVRIDGRVYRGATAGTGDAMPFIVNDNMEVKGDLTVADVIMSEGDPLAKRKVYSGSFNVASVGDEQATYDYDVDCVANPTYTDQIVYHWKKVAVPEISLSDMPNLRAHGKINLDEGYGMPDYYPEINNSYANLSYITTQGNIYFLYKYVVHVCNGSTNPLYYMDGNYKIVVLY